MTCGSLSAPCAVATPDNERSPPSGKRRIDGVHDPGWVRWKANWTAQFGRRQALLT
jgi:hypothetical protein